MKIGLFFGSFNPIHIGHKVIASYFVNFTDLAKVIFVVSPQNPLKQKTSLLDQYHRLQIIRAEIEDNSNLEVSDIEFDMPKPSYTIDTLVRLKEKYPAIPTYQIDERFTSKIAKKTILASGVNKKGRRNKALVDKVSATIILQNYLYYR